MTPTETQKLTDELNASVVPTWDTIDELTAMRHEIVTQSASGEHRQIVNFRQAVDLYKKLDGQKSDLEAQMKTIKEAVQAAVLVAGVPKVRCGDYRVNIVEKKGSQKIVAERLLAQGVDASVIVKATEIGKSSSYVDIRREKD